MKYITIIIVFIMLFKFRWHIMGLYIDWIEPRQDDDMPPPYVGVSEEHDYHSIKNLIKDARDAKDLKIYFTLIEMFQDEYPSFSGLQKVNTLINLHQEKEAEITSRNVIPIEKAG